MSKKKETKDILNDFTDEQKDKDEVARTEALRVENKYLRSDFRKAQARIGVLLDFRDFLNKIVPIIPPLRPWSPPKADKKKPKVEALFLFSDTHVGENTRPAQVENWNRYNYAIATARTARYVHDSLKWINILRQGYEIKKCHVVVLGDMIGGEIHEDMIAANEFPVPVQVIGAGRLLTSLVSSLSRSFDNVMVHCVSGSNHGRRTKKRSFKDAVINNYDFIVYEYARASLKNCNNVELSILPSQKTTINICNYWFLCGHGDHVRAWMGIPWYGLERDYRQESKRRLERVLDQIRREKPVEGALDFGLGAHWHTPFVGPSMKYLINGSLSGSCEYDHAAGRAARPQQVAALVSQKHGLFSPVFFRLDDESSETNLIQQSGIPGWIEEDYQ